MCIQCGMTPCHRGCSNAQDPPKVYHCKYCGEDIVEGEEYVELEGEHYHQECFEDNAVLILMEEYGAIKGVAEVERCLL